MRIGGLQKFTLSDYPGVPAAIIFTQGCNYRCPFCHNGNLLPMQGSEEIEVEEVLSWLRERQGKLDGVVITGGEPTLQADLGSFICQIREMGYKIKLDSNGSHPEVLEKLLDQGLIDFVAMDVKAPAAKYSRLCGVKVNLEHIEQSMEIIAKSGVEHLFRTTYVEAFLDEADLAEIRGLIPTGSTYVQQSFRPENALSEELRQTKSD
ncbi:anaerobic ribonucleoside-triphosphate reductase activating protein [Desulfotalea psychrophila]|uniref:Related to pyruvate formate-lyase activating enzyme n=1 Tax=Desulfotalea psychrophila (strain LSv54 / DSM 12343) TaxID=177439 RepID=Q6AS81_DESPS|nr:anaerobic ribonucleoside-triphosphate reductase activating protein [Desulfotalea psychrophila]CAG34794.1 related to pyruvate formate-lyase activating enzyme [Desulfotalea psychrophila LSv54]